MGAERSSGIMKKSSAVIKTKRDLLTTAIP